VCYDDRYDGDAAGDVAAVVIAVVAVVAAVAVVNDDEDDDGDAETWNGAQSVEQSLIRLTTA